MKKAKTLKTLLATTLVVAMLAMTVAAAGFGDNYPASVDEGFPAPSDGVIMMGTIIGAEGGWGDNPDVGRYAAFDGDFMTFYDPAAANNPEHFVGIRMDEPYILTEIRIHPRVGFLGRFLGAAIWGFDGDVFDPDTATLIWESLDEADMPEWQVIPASEFIDGANTGFTSFAYFNQFNHGDVAGVELWGNPAAAPAEVEPEPTPPAVEAVEPTVEYTPAPAYEPTPPPATAPAAPATSDMRIIVALAILAVTAFITLRMTKTKNRA